MIVALPGLFFYLFLNLAVERGICKEEAECSLIGEIVIFNLLVILI